MRFARVFFLLSLAPGIPAFAEETPAETPKAVHFRMVQALRNGDFKAWRAAFDPKTIEHEAKTFAKVASFPDDSARKRTFAGDAGIPAECLSSLNAEKFAEKCFFNSLDANMLAQDLSVYLATPLEIGPVARVELLLFDGNIGAERFRKVAGAWKFAGRSVEEPPSETEVSVGAACDRWKDAVTLARGSDLFQLYSAEIRRVYLCSWGPELEKLETAGTADRVAAARELDVGANDFASMSSVEFVGLRLRQILNTWLRQGENQWKMNHMGWGLSHSMEGDRHWYQIASPPMRSLEVTDGKNGARVSSDFLGDVAPRSDGSQHAEPPVRFVYDDPDVAK